LLYLQESVGLTDDGINFDAVVELYSDEPEKEALLQEISEGSYVKDKTQLQYGTLLTALTETQAPVFYQTQGKKTDGTYQIEGTNESYQLTHADYEKFQTICDYIYNQFDITFGNRILNQIAELVPVFVACGGKKEDALDFLLSRKVISKIEGRFEEYVKGALKELLGLIQKTYGVSVLKRSEKTIQSLMRRL